jgi:hypothetical protein
LPNKFYDICHVSLLQLLSILFYRFFLAGETGIEPATPGFGDRCSTN